MKCPRCGSTKAERYRSPITRDDVTLRRHRCKDCGFVYMTAQVVVTDELVPQLLEVFE